jgi:hypothetical protein
MKQSTIAVTSSTVVLALAIAGFLAENGQEEKGRALASIIGSHPPTEAITLGKQMLEESFPKDEKGNRLTFGPHPYLNKREGQHPRYGLWSLTLIEQMRKNREGSTTKESKAEEKAKARLEALAERQKKQTERQKAAETKLREKAEALMAKAAKRGIVLANPLTAPTTSAGESDTPVERQVASEPETQDTHGTDSFRSADLGDTVSPSNA